MNFGEEGKTVRDYFNDYGRRGRITSKILKNNIEFLRKVFNSELGKDLLTEDVERFETLLWRLIDKGYGYEDGKVNDDDLVELRYLKERILKISKRISQYIETGKGE